MLNNDNAQNWPCCNKFLWYKSNFRSHVVRFPQKLIHQQAMQPHDEKLWWCHQPARKHQIPCPHKSYCLQTTLTSVVPFWKVKFWPTCQNCHAKHTFPNLSITDNTIDCQPLNMVKALDSILAANCIKKTIQNCHSNTSSARSCWCNITGPLVCLWIIPATTVSCALHELQGYSQLSLRRGNSVEKKRSVYKNTCQYLSTIKSCIQQMKFCVLTSYNIPYFIA